MRSSRRPFILPAAALSLVAALTVASPAAAAPATAASSGVASSGVVPASASHLSAGKQPFRGLSARQIRDRSVAALKAAKTFRVSGNELDPTLGRTTYDFHVSAAAGYGSVKSAKGSWDVIRIGNDGWIKYDAKYAATLALPTDLVGSWVHANRNSDGWYDVVRLTSVPSWARWLSSFNLTSRATGKKFTGAPTLRLVQPGPKGGSLYVQTTGPAYPRYTMRNDKLFAWSFYEYNKVLKVTPPPADQIVEPAASS